MKKFKPTKIRPQKTKDYGISKTTTAKTRMLALDDRLPSKQYIKARIEANVKDDTFGAAWDGDTTSAPSRNAVFDYIGSLASTSDVWGVESAASTADTRSRKSGNVGIGDASNLAFDDITHKLTVDGDLRIGAGISSSSNTNKDIYLDDGAILYKYGSSGSTAMLTLNSSNGHKFNQNLAIGSTNPSLPLEINIAESSSLTTADGTGLMQIGADSAANIGLNSTKIQARSGGSASKLNLNIGGGDIDMGSSSSTITSKGDFAVEGNLTVTGTATAISTETVTVFDNFIELNSNYSGTSPTESAGIEVNRGGSTAINPVLRWNETDDKWQLSEAVTGSASFKDIIHTGQTGSVTNAMLNGSIANNKLANDSVTVGTTEIDLGASSTTLAGLTAVTVTGTSGGSGTTALNITGGNSAASNPAVNITGHLVASTKSFNIPHPIHDDKRLVYGCLEGPEHGAYFRGTAKFDLAMDRMPVELPEYWFKLVGDDYTISITPHGPYHVWVDEKLEDGFFVESSSETDVEFDWFVIGGRKDAKIPEVEPQAP
tara:strand:- start:632 stop:2263 length:1632 start_codon:yes stop_codon:yes gene_type:complete